MNVVTHWVPSGGVLRFLSDPEVCLCAAFTSALKFLFFAFCGESALYLGISDSNLKTYFFLPFLRGNILIIIAEGNLSCIFVAPTLASGT